jgi:hypothetical protein
MKPAQLKQIAIYAIGFAGLVHLFLAPEHYQHASAHGIFFVLAGFAELAWVYVFMRRQSEQIYYAGIMIAGGLIVLWVVTLVLPAPFEHLVQVIDFKGIICKLSELVGIVALVKLASLGKVAGVARRSFLHLLSEALIVSLFIGVGTYVASHSFEPMMPFLGGHLEEAP